MKHDFKNNKLNRLSKKLNKGKALLLMFIFVFLFNIFQFVTTSIAAGDTKKITITKKWENDEEAVRPSDITVYIKKTTSTLITGSDLSAKMKTLAGNSGATSDSGDTNITAIKQATDTQYEAIKSSLTSKNEVQSSGEKTYMWFDNGTIYYYSEADNIYMNEKSNNAFRAMKGLTDISGLSGLNTTYVTDMNRMFLDCVKLSSISALSGWDVGNVTNMNFMLGSNYTGTSGTPMSITSIPLGSWNVSKVTNMNSMFKGCKSVTSVDSIKDWDVSNVTTFQQMFNRAGLTDATALKDWNVVRVTNFSMMFANMGLATSKMPAFTNRTGTWNTSGSYTNTSAALTDTAPTVTKTPTADLQTSSSSRWTKNGDTWTYEFTVSNDGSSYIVWEDAVTDYNGTAYAANPVTGVTDSATITNTNTKRKEIAVTMKWDDNIDSSQRPNNVKVHLVKDGTTTEKVSDNSKWTKNNDGTWVYKFYVYDDDSYSVWEDNINYYTSDAPQSSPMAVTNNAVTITNSLNKYNIILKNQVTGNLADTNKEFTFNIKIFNQDGTDVTGNFINDGTVTLKHDGQIAIQNIPEGYKYSIKETDTDYTENYKIEKADGTMESGASNNTGNVTLNQNQTITFINNKEAPPLTGATFNIKPYIVLILIVLASILIFINAKVLHSDNSNKIKGKRFK